jgi:hypothetical protein
VGQVISKLGKKTYSKKKKPRKGQHQKGQQMSVHIQPLDEKSHPIQWTEFPTGVLVDIG